MRKILVLASLAVVAMIGCKSDDNPASNEGSGRMQVTMVDAPASAYDSIIISVQRVEIHASNSASADAWITLNSEAKTYDLLSLVNGVEAVIGDAELAAGTYTQMRLVLGDSCYVYAGGVKIALKVPSSEIKLNINATIRANVTYKLVLDFDATRSLVTTGTGMILKPVIKVLTTSSTGSIEGSINTKASVMAIGGGDTLSTITGSNNSFKIVYVKPETYNLMILSASVAYYDTTLTNVSVVSGQATNVGTINLRAKL
ncbi:MAG: DUF4382 domain-containing protein [Ignavibacteriales bacterium]|nr:DUF4382 domain-containing protein [Ignavibacteriales bacterium]